MIKRLAVSILLALVCLAAFAVPADFRLRAMGDVSASISGNDGSYFLNPASLFFHNKADFFGTEFSLSDRWIRDEGKEFPFLPSGDLKLRFAGTNLAFTGTLDTVSEVNGDNYDALRTATADIAASIGWNFVSAGIGLDAGVSWERENFKVGSSSRIADFFLNMAAAKYAFKPESELAEVRAGIQFAYGGFTFGVLLPKLFTYEHNETAFAWEGLSAGLSYNGTRYHGRARLNTFVFNMAVEVHDLGRDTRYGNAGAELIVQISPEINLAFRGGYIAGLSDMEHGTITAGLGLKYGKVYMNLATEFPVEPDRVKYSICAGYCY